MIGDHPLAENLPEPIDQLGRESDLRHEQQHVRPGQHLGSEVHINFHLPEPVTPPQQHGRAIGKHGTDLLGSLPLRSGSVGRRNCAPPVTGPGATSRSIQVNNPFFHQESESRPIGGESAPGDFRPVGRKGSQLLQRLRCRGARRPIRSSAAASLSAVSASPARATNHLPAGPELVGSKLLLAVSARLHQRRQRHAHHLAQRAHVIIGDPLPETALPLVEQRRTVEHAGDGLDGLEIGAPVVQPPDDAV